MPRLAVDFEEVIGPLCREMNYRSKGHGILLTSVSAGGQPNVMTIGWCLYGWHYHNRPITVVAVRPACHTYTLLDQVGEFVLCVPTHEIAEAVAFCGSASGRDHDKFRETGLTPVPSTHVKPPSIRECPIHIECGVYHKQRPPHLILTPEHRQHPLEQQHTIYYAQVMGTFVLRR